MPFSLLHLSPVQAQAFCIPGGYLKAVQLMFGLRPMLRFPSSLIQSRSVLLTVTNDKILVQYSLLRKSTAVSKKWQRNKFQSNIVPVFPSAAKLNAVSQLVHLGLYLVQLKANFSSTARLLLAQSGCRWLASRMVVPTLVEVVSHK